MKNLNLLVILFFTLFLPLTVSAQSFGKVKGDLNIFPQKIQSPQTGPIAAGTYTIGVSGDFPTLDSAFNKLSMDGIAGSVTLEFIDDLYTAPTTDYGFLLNGPIPGADQNSRVTLRPAPNKNVTIEGSGGCVLCFPNTSYLTIDGIALNGNTTLTIHSNYNNQYGHNQPVSFFDNSDHNEVKNINVKDGDNTYQAAPIGFFVTDGNSSSVPDSNLVENNVIIGGSIGAVIVGLNPLYEPTGNTITGNIIGSETDSLKSWGLFFQLCNNTLIERNIIQNLRINYPEENVTYGIQTYYSENTIIRNNVIHNVYDISGSQGAMGIILQSGQGDSVYNNMIYDIHNSGTAGPGFIAGIILLGETNPKIYFNTIYLSGNGNTVNGSTDLNILDACSNVDLKNNILVNTRDETPNQAFTITDYSSSNIISDYNDLFCLQSPNSFLVGIQDTSYSTLIDWQTTGEDSNSISEMPNFIAPDLHIDPTIGTDIESGGTPISGIETDIDGETRSVTTPDIGADEFDGFVTPVEMTSFTADVYQGNVLIKWSTATETNNRGFEIERQAGSRQSAAGKWEKAGFVVGNGTTSQPEAYYFTDKNITSGTYSYRLKQIDFNGTYSYSKTIELNVNVPLKFSLSQNYPNPFNPTTTIEYSIPKSGNVLLKIYNTLGEEVETLVNRYEETGDYKVNFNALKLSSGIYFYRLTSGSFNTIKKMILLK